MQKVQRLDLDTEAVMKREVNICPYDPNQSGISYVLITRGNSNYRPSKMRKYYQASLALIAAISLISLLFYRHEYNKLRYVLEVFNYFGEPHTKLPNCTENLSKNLVFLAEPFPSWQRLNDELFVYSSFNVEEKKVRSIAFGKMDESLKCEVFFDEEPSPISGSFSHSKIENSLESQDLQEHERQGFYLNCEYAEGQQKPVAVKYYSPKVTSSDDVPMMPIKNSPASIDKDSDESAMCVAPPLEKPISRANMATFLSLHNFIGFQHFVVYDYGIPAAFNRALKNPMEWKFSYETVPWNFPFTGVDEDAILNVIEADCLHRTMNRVAYAVTLSWQEYIVLKHHEAFTTVSNLIAKLERKKIIGSRYAIKTLVFCTEQDDDKQVMDMTSVIFKKTHSYSNIERRSVDVCKPHEVVGVESLGKKEISNNFIMVNRYQRCRSISNADLESKLIDDSILKFAKDIKNSVVYRKFAQKQLILDD